MSVDKQIGTVTVKRGLAQMLKGGVIMDVQNAQQAIIAQEAGAVAVMALERIPAVIRREGGVARTSHPAMIKRIMDAVTIPVMAKARIGHLIEARQLEALGVDYIDESEVLTPADDKYHIDKLGYSVPFVNGAKDLGEALRRIAEGSSMIRSKGEAGSGNIVEAVRHLRAINDEIALLSAVPREELVTRARDLGAPLDLVQYVAEHRKLPVVLFSAGGVATPADAALMMAMGAEGVFVGSGIFDGHNDEEARAFAKAIVDATTHWNDPNAVLAAHLSIPEAAAAMRGIDLRELAESQMLAHRGS